MSMVLYLCYNFFMINNGFALSSNETKINDLNALEQEKSELVQKIHEAIDDSVKLLEKENTTQNMEGIRYMLELKQQIEQPSAPGPGNTTSVEESNSTLENRRKMSRPKLPWIKRQLKLNGTKLGKEFDINRLLNNKKLTKDQIKKLMDSRLAMQKRIDEWIVQRQIEKAKMRHQYLVNKKLERAGLLEKCPRYGYKNSGRKKTRRGGVSGDSGDSWDSWDTSDTEEKPLKVRRNKNKKKYPCCRKCCKKSYMGCL